VSAEHVLVLTAAFGAGLVDAIAGGGGLIQLPALFAAFPQAPHTTLLGTSKVAGLASTLSAASRYLRHVRIDRGLVGAAAVCAFAGAPVGAWIASQVAPQRFRALVPALLCVVLAITLLRPDFGRHAVARTGGRRMILAAAAGAGAIGVYNGFFGPGTGTFLMFLFVQVAGCDFLHASASAKLVNAAANAAAILTFGLTGEVYWLLGLAMAACGLAGAQIGSHLAIRRGSGFVRAAFIVVVGALIAKTAADALRFT
jgi:uncharacterized membrane protein YfcA